MPPTPSNAKPIVVAVERIECPTCEGVIPSKCCSSDYDEHPKLPTLRRTIRVDCPYCGDKHTAELSLQGGVWTTDSITTVAYKRSA